MEMLHKHSSSSQPAFVSPSNASTEQKASMFQGLESRDAQNARSIYDTPNPPPPPPPPTSRHEEAATDAPGSAQEESAPQEDALAKAAAPKRSASRSRFSLAGLLGSNPSKVSPQEIKTEGDKQNGQAMTAGKGDADGRRAGDKAGVVQSTSMDKVTEESSKDGDEGAYRRTSSAPSFSAAQVQNMVPAKGAEPQKSNPGKGMGRSVSSIFGYLFGASGSSTTSGGSKQAKLGEENQFYYDEKLKRWVERGKENLEEAKPLAPPPTSFSFQATPTATSSSPNATSADASVPNSDPLETAGNSKASGGFPSGGISESGQGLRVPSALAGTGNGEGVASEGSPANLGVPLVPPRISPFTARRASVRSRYVDTFNKSSSMSSQPAPAATSAALLPSISSKSKPPAMNFFVPAAPVQPLSEGAEQLQGQEEQFNQTRASSTPAEAS